MCLCPPPRPTHLQGVHQRLAAVVKVQHRRLAAGAQHARQLTQRPRDVRHVAQAVTHCHRIKLAVTKGQRQRIALQWQGTGTDRAWVGAWARWVSHGGCGSQPLALLLSAFLGSWQVLLAAATLQAAAHLHPVDGGCAAAGRLAPLLLLAARCILEHVCCKVQPHHLRSWSAREERKAAGGFVDGFD